MDAAHAGRLPDPRAALESAPADVAAHLEQAGPSPAPPLVSLVLVSYNNIEDIDRLATSLHGTTYPSLEVILIDNGSTDGTIDRLASAYPDLLVAGADADNRGYGAACNRGAELAGGDVVVFLNCDVELERDAVSRLVDPLAADDTIGAAMAKLLVRGRPETINASGGGSHFLGFSWNERCLLDDDEPFAEDVRDVGFASGAALAVRRDAFETVGGFDEHCFMYVEDADLSWRMRIAGYRTVVVSGARVHHDYAFFTGDRRFCYFAERNRIAMLLKCYRWYSLLLLAPLWFGAEIVVIGYAVRERWLREKLAAYVGVLRALPRIHGQRRAVQRSRARGADPWTRVLDGTIRSPHLRHPLVTIGNAVLDPVWSLLRAVVR